MRSLERADRLKRGARAAVALGIALLLLGVAIRPTSSNVGVAVRTFSEGTSTAASASTNISVNVTDGGFSPATVSLAAGSSATFHLHNVGTYAHTFTISKVANFTIQSNDTPAELASFFATNGSLLNVSLSAGVYSNDSLSVPGSDAGASFEIVSLVAYQFQAGYSGFLHVTFATTTAGYSLATNTTSQLLFSPNELVIPSVKSYPIAVSVEIVNLGSSPHTFYLTGFNNYTVGQSNFTDFFNAHAPLAGVNVPGFSGGAVWANFTITAGGTYQFICTIPSHYSNGMFGWLYVGYSPAPPPVPPSTAIVDIGVLIGGAALLGLAVLVTLIAQFTGRFPPAPPKPGHH